MRIGLTGGIGSGKSTVAQILVKLGANLVDADAISKMLTARGGEAIPAIRAVLPQLIIDDILDRQRAREAAFSDASIKSQIEAILHPLVSQKAEELADLGGEPVVFDIPLLVETKHWLTKLDKIIVVDCSVETQIERVMKRNGLSREQVQAVIDRQASREQRLAVADAVIKNEGKTHEQLQLEVQAVWYGLVNT